MEEREGLKSGLGPFTILLQSAQKAAGSWNLAIVMSRSTANITSQEVLPALKTRTLTIERQLDCCDFVSEIEQIYPENITLG